MFSLPAGNGPQLIAWIIRRQSFIWLDFHIVVLGRALTKINTQQTDCIVCFSQPAVTPYFSLFLLQELHKVMLPLSLLHYTKHSNNGQTQPKVPCLHSVGLEPLLWPVSSSVQFKHKSSGHGEKLIKTCCVLPRFN